VLHIGQLIESSQPVLSSVSTPPQVAPPSVEVTMAGPPPAPTFPAAWQVGRPPETGRQATLNSDCRPARVGSDDNDQVAPPSVVAMTWALPS
jgi:hypothetical protein